jgi:hypothetical protein
LVLVADIAVRFILALRSVTKMERKSFPQGIIGLNPAAKLSDDATFLD